MARAYNVIDADGHILEPLNLWSDYIEPKYRDKAPKLIRDEEGKQRLQVGEQLLGSKKGLGALGGVGARDGPVVDDAMEYEQGRKGGFDPHARIPTWTWTHRRRVPVSQHRAVRRRGAGPRPQRRCHAPTIGGSRTTVSRIRIGCSASR
jgi:hypothetical protein